MKPPAVWVVAIGLCVIAGCKTGPNLNATTTGHKLTYWEFRELAGVDVETSPEAQELVHDGWIFSGYSLPYPNENVRVDFPAGFPKVVGIRGHYYTATNSFGTVAHFRRIAKVVVVQ